MKIQKSEIKGYHFFYVAFFVGYFLLIYFLLYHPNGLSPFQVNIHFFSNVIGSLSKRFLAEAAPYALLFYLIYYARKKWLRISLIICFLSLFTVNIFNIFYYFVTRTDIQFYVIRAFEWKLFLSYFETREILLAIAFMASISGLGYMLKNPNPISRPSLQKQFLSITLLICLILIGFYKPIFYSPHKNVLSTDSLIKAQQRLIQLENPGIVTLLTEVKYEFFRPVFVRRELTLEEKNLVASLGLEEKLTITSSFRPKNIVLIAAESLNQAFLSRYNESITGTTPFMDSLIENYPQIDEFYPSGTYTLFGLSALLCSHTNAVRTQKDSNFKCLPNILADNAYHTEFIRGFSKYYIGENVFFDKIGFDSITAREEFDLKYPDFSSTRPDLYRTWGFSDNYLFDEVIERLKKNVADKLFITVLTVDTHAGSGRCYRQRNENDPENSILFSVNCFDSVMKDFFAKLHSEGLFDDELLIILTADHLYPNYTGLPGNNENISFTNRPARIPLVFISKKPVELMADRGSQIDVAPTILDLLEIDAPEYFMGKSLLANRQTVPMGSDRLFAYLIIHDQFTGFNLADPASTPFIQGKQSSGAFLKTFSNDFEELELQIQQLRIENTPSENSGMTLIDWYKNQL